MTLSLRTRRAIWIGLIAAWTAVDAAWRVSAISRDALPSSTFLRIAEALTLQLGEHAAIWLPLATVLILSSRRMLDRRLWSSGLALVVAFCIHELGPAVTLQRLTDPLGSPERFENVPSQALTSSKLLVAGGHGALLTDRLVRSLEAVLLLLPAFLATRRSCPPASWPIGIAVALLLLGMLAFQLLLPNAEWCRLVPGVAGFLALTWGARRTEWSDERVGPAPT